MKERIKTCMKFKFKLSPSNAYQKQFNSDYLNPVDVDSLDAFKGICTHDYVCTSYKDNHRCKESFLSATCVPFDIDNDHSDKQEDWLDVKDVADFFYGVPFLVQYSRHHMKQKDNKSPRPRFHVIFPIDEIANEEDYRNLKVRIHSIFPYVDVQALDSARFFYGTDNPEVDYVDGYRNLTDFLKELDEVDAFAGLDEGLTILEGSRNSTMHKYAVKILKRYGLSEEAKEQYRLEAGKCIPPLEKDELNTIWKSALKYYQSSIATNPDYIKPDEYNNPTWDEIIPLDDVNLPAFPIDALPDVLRNYVLDVAESTQTPIDMAGVTSLAIMSIAMQPSYKVIGKSDWEEQLSLYCMIVAEPSDRKSAVFNQIIKVIQSFEADYNERHSIDVLKSQEEHSSLEKRYKKASKDYENGKITKDEYKRMFRPVLMGSIIGSCVGIVPGTGASEASWFSYNTAKNLSKHPEEFGHGSVEGVAAAESANNAVCGATLIPLLTLGIPGDGCVAIMLSALMINGLNPGLSLFTTDGAIMYAIMLGLILVNIFMFLQGKYLTSLFAKVVSIPQQILTPIIVIFCFAGAYSVNSSYFDLSVALVFGVMAWFMRKLELPAVPVLLGMVLGNMTETNFRRALLISDGSPKIFFSSVYCWIFIALIVVVIIGILRGKMKEAKVKQ